MKPIKALKLLYPANSVIAGLSTVENRGRKLLDALAARRQTADVFVLGSGAVIVEHGSTHGEYVAT